MRKTGFAVAMAAVMAVSMSGLAFAGETEAATEAEASTGIRSVGPDGEAAVDGSTIELTDDQIAQVKDAGYKAAICLHYGGNDWSTSQQQGLEDSFKEYGIEVVAGGNGCKLQR